MNSNLPPIKKFGPAIAPKPKNIKIQAGRVVFVKDYGSDFLEYSSIAQPPLPPPPLPPPLISSQAVIANELHRNEKITSTNNNNNNTEKLKSSIENQSNYDINNRNSLDSLPQPPSPSFFNSFETNNKYLSKLHASLYQIQENDKNSTINVSSDSSNRPTITITARSQNPALKNLNYENDEPRTYNIPIQHISSTTPPTTPPPINREYQSLTNTNTNVNSNGISNGMNTMYNENRNMDSTLSSVGKNMYLSKPQNQKLNTEDQVDIVKNMLMKNLIGSKDPNFQGICSKCGESILSPDIGLKAMDQLFHFKCFNCISCGCLLKDKHFYAIDNKSYCEMCYMRLLEKCSICTKPITDRILRATGKPFHPKCFNCSVCASNLDGIPFTVDAANKIHCIDCFHNKYAPRCHICHLPITPEPGQEETTRIVALDKSFHVNCYKCEDCGIHLSSTGGDKVSGCYPLDEHIYCKNCNILRIRNLKISQIIPNNLLTPRSTDL